MADTVDELHSLRKAFFLGGFQQAVNEAAKRVAPAAQGEQKAVLHRAFLAQGRRALALDVAAADKDSPELRALAALAAADADAAARLFATTTATATPLLAVLVASALFNAARFDDALATLHAAVSQRDFDVIGLRVQTLVALNRLDLARKEVAAMKAWADDATQAQLIEAWINLLDPEKANDAFYTFDELVASNTATAKLLTSKAVAKIQSGDFLDAEAVLTEALNLNNNEPEALINLIVCAHATGKPAELVTRLTNQLRDAAPNHVYLQELSLKEQMFDRSAQRFALWLPSQMSKVQQDYLGWLWNACRICHGWSRPCRQM
ncbi:coatomer epsilon subunit-domain-containing protein [Obelidium mucronatum]|nr:coatomer epsilon subunit-domain-containing protein [Obelidium mucronatum]